MSEFKRYRHLAERVFDTPLLIEPDKLRTIAEIILPRTGIDFTKAKVDGEKERDRLELQVIDGTAVIDVHGTLVQRNSWMNAFSGLTSYEQLTEDLREAEANEDVTNILLIIDSPGGEASGAFDFADRVKRTQKPTWAIAEDMAASAAYLIGSAADRFFVTQSAITGSIGVVIAHIDQSGYNEQQGIKVTEIHAGKRKVDASPHKPLSSEGRKSLQQLVDDTYDLFVAHVARNRGMDEDAVRSTEARVFVGGKAVKAGLADGVMDLDAVLDRFRGNTSGELGMTEDEKNAVQAEVVDGIGNRLMEWLGMRKEEIVTDVDEVKIAEEEKAELEARIAEQAAELETLKAEILAREDAEREAEAQARIEKLAALGVTEEWADEVGEMSDGLFEVLARANTQLATGDLFSELGRTGEDTEEKTAEQKLQDKADEIRKQDASLSAEAAFDRAMRDNPALYRDYLSEHPDQVQGQGEE